MRQILTMLAVLLFVQAHSQTDKSVPVSDMATYGYVNGQRIDSVDAVYGSFDLNGSNRVHFDYGQNRIDRKEYLLTDVNGKPLSFSNHSTAFLLNFFYYNRWELVCGDINTGWTIKRR